VNSETAEGSQEVIFPANNPRVLHPHLRTILAHRREDSCAVLGTVFLEQLAHLVVVAIGRFEVCERLEIAL
jgi:hypothetical protein